MHPVINAFLDDGGDEIVLYEQAPEGVVKRRVRAEYTTYHHTEDVSADLMRLLKQSDQVAHVAHETKKWLRIGWKTEVYRRQARYKLKDANVDTFEGDVNPVRYWLTQTNVHIAKPRRCYLDIEADSRVSFSKKEEMRILCWAISDDTGPIAKGILSEDTDDAEATLLTKLWKVLESYDQVCAWYGGDPEDKDKGFDFYVIAKRTARCGLPIDTRRWLWLDQLTVWRRMNSAESGDEKESMRLEDIAQNQVGEGKEATPDWVIEKFGNKGLGALAWELWHAGGKYRKLLADYCVKDTELLRKLESRKGFLTLFQSVCEATAVFGNTFGLFPTGQMDGFLLRLGREHDYRFATKTYYDGDDKKKGFEGAFVLAPRTVESPPDDTGKNGWSLEEANAWRHERGMSDGILRNVHVCDFASLYPSNIITWNLSEEVKVTDDAFIEKCYALYKAGEEIPDGFAYSPGTGVVTRTDKVGILPLALRELLRLRKQYADEAKKYAPGTPQFVDAMAKSTAYKVVANSFYGVAGSKTSRYFNKDIARSTTQNGVWLIKNVMKEGEKRKIVAVAGDTDSSFVIGPTRTGFANFVQWLNASYLPKIIKATGAKDSTVKLEFEKSFDILVFSTKKRYCGRYNHYKWKTTCNHCKDAKGNPGAVDVRTLKCTNKECEHQYTEQPIFLGKPEIKGLEYRRGDALKLAREMQGQVIDLLVGGLKLNPGLEDIARPVMDLRRYEAIIEKWRDRVLTGVLTRQEVRISKSIKDLSEYASEAKQVEGEKKKSVPTHVAVAKILEERGQSITAGTKIEYVVVDSDVSPMRVIPAEDFDGECDRYYLWDTLIYPPTQRLLEGAFPETNWKSWADVRPAKVKKGKKVHENQLGLSFTPKPKAERTKEDYSDLAVPTFTKTPLIVRIPESAGEAGMMRVQEVLKANPGARSVEIVIALESGQEAILKSSMRVSTGPKLRLAVEAALAAS